MYRFLSISVLVFALFPFLSGAAGYQVRGRTWNLPHISPPPRAPVPKKITVHPSKRKDVYRLPVMGVRKDGVASVLRHVKLKRPVANGVWLFVGAGQMSNSVYNQFEHKSNTVFLYGNTVPGYLHSGKAQVFRANDALAHAFGVHRIPSVVTTKGDMADVVEWK